MAIAGLSTGLKFQSCIERTHLIVELLSVPSPTTYKRYARATSELQLKGALKASAKVALQEI
eukprot:2525031-Amphidinium_carterae.2